MNESYNWYALKVFQNRVLQMQEDIRKEAETESETVQTYIAMTEDKKPLIASLMFVRCSEDFLKALKDCHFSEFCCYTRFAEDKKVPAVIPEDQMQTFIWLTSEDYDVSYIGEPKDISFGDRVKVVEGPFKGLEGYVKRIKKDRKFVLTVGSIAAFTIEGITYKMMQKIQ